jgi:hypothetical protein
MPSPTAVRMTLLAGILAIPVLPPFITDDDVTSFRPPVPGPESSIFATADPLRNGMAQSGEWMMVLGQSEVTPRESGGRCRRQKGVSIACVSVE